MNVLILSPYIKTTTDIVELKRTLDHMSDSLYRINDSAEEALRNSLPYDLALQVKKLSMEEGIDLNDKARAQEFFSSLGKQLAALPVIQITLAFQPKEELIKRIQDWFYRTLSTFVVLDIAVNPDIIAGAIVTTNGKYYDFSLEKQTEKFFGGAL